MVKLTLVGRLSDGMPLAQTPTYMNEGNDVFSEIYRQKGELVLKEIARGGLTSSRMSIAIDHHSFHYLIGEGVCCITLCDSWYPRKLAFYYLEDLQSELRKMGSNIVDLFSAPYSFKRFDYIIFNTTKRYMDTRTHANLAKLKFDHQKDSGIVTKHFSEIISKRQASGPEEESSTAFIQDGPKIWNSQLLEVIALKWTPLGIMVAVVLLLLWTTFVLHECNNLAVW